MMVSTETHFTSERENLPKTLLLSSSFTNTQTQDMSCAAESDGDRVVDFSELPEGCIDKVVALTSPREAPRLACVSKTFKSAADSDAVWEHFLPSDYTNFVPEQQELELRGLSKKEVFIRLCKKPLLIDQGKKSFWLDKTSGKKCFMISAKDLKIVWGDTPRYWRWISDPEATFRDVAELISVCWFEIGGSINSSMLSQTTVYAAYLVYKTTPGFYGFDDIPVNVEVRLVGNETCKGTVQFARYNRNRLPSRRCLNPVRWRSATLPGIREDKNHEGPKKRVDNWLEVKLGEFCNNEENRDIEMSVMEVEIGNWKGGIVVQGIEIRPKD